MQLDACNLPFTAIGNSELGGWFEKSVRCPNCGEAHTLEFGTKRTMRTDGTWSDPVTCKSTAFYRCGDKTYMAGIGGRYLPGLEES